MLLIQKFVEQTIEYLIVADYWMEMQNGVGLFWKIDSLPKGKVLRFA